MSGAAGGGARQRHSHSELIRDLSQDLPRRGRSTPLDAIVIPAARRAERLRPAAELAAAARTLLVVLASHECLVPQVAMLVASIPGCRALIAEVPHRYAHRDLNFQTSGDAFRDAKAGRNSNLSLKRNLGLMLARLLGWGKIMFLDDDILDVTPTDLVKIAAQLDHHEVAGLISRSYPDNSVVCHAHRLSGQFQDIFLTGAALGVNCWGEPLDFFPDIYNEDWFFFAEHAARGQAISVGTARQQAFNPFKNPYRAVEEEFGDLIGEGLYALFNDGRSLNAATLEYWKDFIQARRDLIDRVIDELAHVPTHEAVQAQESMRHAQKQLASIDEEDCFRFVRAWREDRGVFARTSHNLPRVNGYAAALGYLHLPTWQEAAFAQPNISRQHEFAGPTRLGRRGLQPVSSSSAGC